MKVAVLDTTKKVLAPTTPRRARLLLDAGKAAVFRRYPFTIILKREVEHPVVPTFILKLDPGSKTTGIAIVNQQTGEVVFAAELEHRGQAIKDALTSRRAIRSGRRNRKLRRRPARFDNRKSGRPLPPSLNSRVENITSWVQRLIRAYPISGLAVESVRFDIQLMENPDIAGVEYQHGELMGFEVKEYLLLKFEYTCAYARVGSPCDDYLEVEHIIPKSQGGTNRVSNLTIACHKHNQEKGSQTATEYGFPDVQTNTKMPLKDAAAVNSTRKVLLEQLKSIGLPLETGSGGLTKFNRVRRGLPKTHWVDAACVGPSTPVKLNIKGVKPLKINATRHGSRQAVNVDAYGFPISTCADEECKLTYRTYEKHDAKSRAARKELTRAEKDKLRVRVKPCDGRVCGHRKPAAKGGTTYQGFKTGDMVKATMPNGKYAGQYVGRIAIRQRESFSFKPVGAHKYFDVNIRNIKRIHRNDGFSYQT